MGRVNIRGFIGVIFFHDCMAICAYINRYNRDTRCPKKKNTVTAQIALLRKIILRPSGSEPVLRLVVEAETIKIMKEKVEELTNIIIT